MLITTITLKHVMNKGDWELTILFSSFQSSVDLWCSFVLLLTSLLKKGHFYLNSDGILGHLECSVWNSNMLLWAGFGTSTWNLVCLTVER